MRPDLLFILLGYLSLQDVLKLQTSCKTLQRSAAMELFISKYLSDLLGPGVFGELEDDHLRSLR